MESPVIQLNSGEREEEHDLRDVIGMREPAKGLALDRMLQNLLIGKILGRHIRLHVARRHTVDPNLSGSQFEGPVTGESRSFGRAVQASSSRPADSSGN